jgi:NF-kappa-B-repressing factor
MCWPLSQVGEGAKPIHQSNVGNKLLRTLGWSGGGLGKAGDGIVAPIYMRIKNDKCGLGF